MSGMGLVHRKSLSLLRTVAHIDQTYYPERLGRVCVCTQVMCYYHYHSYSYSSSMYPGVCAVLILLYHMLLH